MTAIIILNWNGWEDTVECLSSLKNVNEDFFIVLIDNGSTNDSIAKISYYLKYNWPYDYYFHKENDDIHINTIKKHDIIFYSLKENYGFAKGNNKGLELAKKFNPKFGLLLNNDTIVDSHFLTNLLSFKKSYPKFSILTPLIFFYSNKNIIWNAGGKLLWGFRKYYYVGEKKENINNKNYIKISFITGCCLFFDFSIIKDNSLLTERFFHGEEDFEFSIRMKKNKIKMACVLDSIIYHKVSRSVASNKDINKIYIYYLNRFINMKQIQNPIIYFFWKSLYKPYIKILLSRQNYGKKLIKNFIVRLNKESKELDEVNKEKFFSILKETL